MESRIISNVTQNAPIQADSVMPILIPRDEITDAPNIELPKRKSAQPRTAPELIHIIYGSARGFLKRVCICNPQILNAIPDIKAVIALGIR